MNTLPLVALKGIEPLQTWEQVCTSPNALFQEFARRFVVDAGDINSLSIIKSPTTPGPKDRSKVWIKTSFPFGIGLMIDGVYKMDYGISGYPQNTPFLHREIETLPGPELRLLTTGELASFGMTDTVSAADRMRWYLFEPGEITNI